MTMRIRPADIPQTPTPVARPKAVTPPLAPESTKPKVDYSQPIVVVPAKGNGVESLSFVEPKQSELEKVFGTKVFASREVTSTDKTDHFFINGIRTSQENAQKDADALTSILQENYSEDLRRSGLVENTPPGSPSLGVAQERIEKTDFELLYNPTSGTLTDVNEAVRNLSGLKTSAAEDTADRFMETLNKGRNIFVVAHSQGGAITADALRRVERRLLETHPPSEVQEIFTKRVNIKTMGSFAPDYAYPTGISVEAYKNDLDFVPKLGKAVYDVQQSKNPRQVLHSSATLAATTIGAFVVNLDQALEQTTLQELITKPKQAFGKMAAALDDHSTQTKDRSMGYIHQIEHSEANQIRSRPIPFKLEMPKHPTGLGWSSNQ